MSSSVHFKVLLLLHMVFLFSATSFSQRPAYQQYTVEDGLPSSLVFSACQDREGYMWLGTDAGLAKFDGYSFKTYTIKHGLPSNSVWLILQDSSARIWAFTTKGIAQVFEDTAIVLPDYVTPSPHPRMDSTGHYWIRLREGILHLGKDSIYSLDSTNSDFKLYVAFLDYAEDGSEMFAGAYGIYIRHGDSTAFYPYSPPQKLAVDAIVLNNPPVIRLGSGIAWFRDGKFGTAPIKALFGEQYKFLRIGQVRNSNYYFAITPDDLIIFDGQRKKVESWPYFKDYRIGGIAIDADGNYWLTTLTEGVFVLKNPKAIAIYDHDSGLENEDIKLLVEDRQYVTFWGGLDGVLGRWQSYSFEETQLTGIGDITAIAPKGVEELYVGTDRNGLVIGTREHLLFGKFSAPPLSFQNEVTTNFPVQVRKTYPAMRIKFGSIKQLLPDGNGNIWVATNNGLYRIEDRNNYLVIHKIYNGRINCLANDGHETTWFAGVDGFFKYWRGSVFPQQLHAPWEKNIISLSCSPEGVLWMATDGYGLFGFYEEEVLPIKETANDIVQCVFAGPHGRVYAGTNKGLWLLTLKSSQSGSYDCSKLTSEDGLPSNKINAILFAKTRLYIATSHGLAVVKEENLHAPEVSPPIFIKEMGVWGENEPEKPNVRLHHHQNNVTINFVGISHSSNGNLTYRYRLDGLDTSWHTTKTTEVHYQVLKPGSYRFQVFAQAADGRESRLPATFRFSIKPPFWQTWWFKACSLLLSISAVLLVVFFRVRYIKKREAEHTKINKQFAELELKALQAQMNPHFIFNALNAIQHFVLMSDERAASSYLSKFAKLMRMFLESSKSKFITLKEELNLLQLYVEMEKLS